MKSTSAPRQLWADAARGIAILAVVLYHLVSKHAAVSEIEFDAHGVERLQLAVYLFGAIRMPLFFAISGMFAASALSRSWPVLLRSKTWFFYYLYVLWLIIQTALFQLTPQFGTTISKSVADLLVQLTIEPSTLWYLYALALYFPLAKLFSRMPMLTLAVALGISIAATSGLARGMGNLPSVLQFFVWFAVGAYVLKPSFNPQSVRVWWFIGAGVGYAGAVGAMKLVGGNSYLLVVASVFGILVGLAGAVLLERHARPVAVVLAYVGRRTLPIYVLHLPLVAAIHALMPNVTIVASFAGTLAYAILGTIAISGLALLFYEFTNRFAPLLFRPPHTRTKVEARESAVRESEFTGDAERRTD